MGRLRFDHHPDAGQASSKETVVKRLGQRTGDERHPFDPVRRRVQVDGHRQVTGYRATLRRAVLGPRGQPVGGQALGPEPADHIAHREGGERPQGDQAQSGQHVSQLGTVQYHHRLDGQKRPCGPDRHDQRPHPGPGSSPGGQTGGERPVSHPDPTGRTSGSGDVGQRLDHRRRRALHQVVLPVEETTRTADAEGADAGPTGLHPRGDVTQGGDHRLEPTGLPGLVGF